MRRYSVVMADAQDFAAYLDRAIKAVDMSAADLARAMGVSDSVISKWLRGTVPTIENLRLLAPVLRVPPMELFVVAGHVTLEEAGLSKAPAPPGPPATTEDAIRADPRLTERGKQILLDLLPGLEERAKARREAKEDERPRKGRRSA